MPDTPGAFQVCPSIICPRRPAYDSLYGKKMEGYNRMVELANANEEGTINGFFKI